MPLSLREAIRYSLQLARRNWWRTTIVFSVAIAVLFVFYAVGLVFALFATMAVGVADVAVASSVALRVIATMGAFAEPFLCALLLAIYADVQVRKESAESAQSVAATANG
jgi:membrane-anchored glycerophosphoryl diester phosphodiesterase (GDPDase)